MTSKQFKRLKIGDYIIIERWFCKVVEIKKEELMVYVRLPGGMGIYGVVYSEFKNCKILNKRKNRVAKLIFD